MVRFLSFVIRLGILLALAGQLKACTLELAREGTAHRAIMSYSKSSRMLTAP